MRFEGMTVTRILKLENYKFKTLRMQLNSMRTEAFLDKTKRTRPRSH